MIIHIIVSIELEVLKHVVVELIQSDIMTKRGFEEFFSRIDSLQWIID